MAAVENLMWQCVSKGKKLRLRFGVGLLSKEVKFVAQIVGAVCHRFAGQIVGAVCHRSDSQ